MQLKLLQYVGGRIVLLSLFGVLACHSKDKILKNSATHDSSIQLQSRYPKAIADSNLMARFDNAKWGLYCIYGMQNCEFLHKGSKTDSLSVPYSELDLKFLRSKRLGDSVELYFSFYRDTVRCDVSTVRDPFYLEGAGFVGQNDTVCYWISPTPLHLLIPGSFYRYFAPPLYTSWLDYLKSNPPKLNEWLRLETKRRGAITN